THDPQEALALADRIAVLNAGRLQQVDRPAVVHERPVNCFVAAFLGGPMNFFDGELVQDQGRLTFVTDGWRLPLPHAGETLPANANRAVNLGLRAEDVEIGEATPGTDSSWSLEMRVVLVEPTGQGALVTLQALAGSLKMQGCQRRGKECKIEEGEKVMVHG